MTVRLACAAALLALAQGAGAQAPMRFVTEPFPPYTYAGPEGHAAGPMADVLQAACAKLAWRCDVEVLPWRRALAMAQRGEVEGIFTVVDSPERRQYFHVSPPIIDARYVLFARSGGFQYGGDPQTLAGRTIGAYGPSATALTLEQLIDDVPRTRSEIEPDNRTVLRKLAAGRYGEEGLALANEAVALHLMREDGIRGLQSVGLVKAFGYSFGLARQNVDLNQAHGLAKALYELCRSGRTAELLKGYGLPASACVKP